MAISSSALMGALSSSSKRTAPSSSFFCFYKEGPASPARLDDVLAAGVYGLTCLGNHLLHALAGSESAK
eukprot:10273553-Alexandrium_andersonii.AAC.1